MLAKLLLRDGGRMTQRGQRVSDAIDTVLLLGLFLTVFGIVGAIETGRWF
jgi:hypothetical protein